MQSLRVTFSLAQNKYSGELGKIAKWKQMQAGKKMHHWYYYIYKEMHYIFFLYCCCCCWTNLFQFAVYICKMYVSTNIANDFRDQFFFFFFYFFSFKRMFSNKWYTLVLHFIFIVLWRSRLIYLFFSIARYKYKRKIFISSPRRFFFKKK